MTEAEKDTLLEAYRLACQNILDAEMDGWGKCRYCRTDTYPVDADGTRIDESGEASEYRCDHKPWCPSAILDAIPDPFGPKEVSMKQLDTTMHGPTPGCACLPCSAALVAQGIIDRVRHACQDDHAVASGAAESRLVAGIAQALILARTNRPDYERGVMNAARSYRRAQHYPPDAFERCAIDLLSAARQSESGPTPEETDQ